MERDHFDQTFNPVSTVGPTMNIDENWPRGLRREVV